MLMRFLILVTLFFSACQQSQNVALESPPVEAIQGQENVAEQQALNNRAITPSPVIRLEDVEIAV